MAETQDMPVPRADEIAAKRDKDDLLDHLDDLLERYLHTLHEYQQVMQQLSKQLSNGYMSLAQANFHNSSTAIRYGQDCYDERMQAIRKVHVSEGQTNDVPHFAVYKFDSPDESLDASDDASKKEDVEKSKDDSEHFTPTVPESKQEEEPKTTSNMEESSPASEEPKEKIKTTKKSNDPLKWFGILVPPALRTAQSAFINAVETPIPQLATLARDMRMQEIEIERVRKQIKKL
ncbi:hypothetical protein COCSADRAFT_139099 [Bipolaris sorokiniana ND90Pr]|uniref:Vacuolar ATPase assembly protein VMA22 n=1 Tax=Cochliobolus sativus (strain ND90Pr / ATCC 201652) TaxID=665912 RepID=M2SSP4_COCSN|nr:uncharacterized protein COCSADRAFT_139099 [Bipolaris sorokiniana ND90Pr]EMD65320.1 hypothetical protein COCSADRAFT_139099 [Bipolaris sorokiniana ND90Pr]